MPPFDKSIRYPSRMILPPEAPRGAALTLPTYSEWLLPCMVVSLAGVPAICVPVCRSSEGLPIGVQLVGRPGGDAELLAAAAILERAVHEAGAPDGSEAAEGTEDTMIDGSLVHRLPIDPRRRQGLEQQLKPWDWDGPRTVDEAAALHGL